MQEGCQKKAVPPPTLSTFRYAFDTVRTMKFLFLIVSMCFFFKDLAKERLVTRCVFPPFSLY